jgi:hypothetical protein
MRPEGSQRLNQLNWGQSPMIESEAVQVERGGWPPFLGAAAQKAMAAAHNDAPETNRTTLGPEGGRNLGPIFAGEHGHHARCARSLHRVFGKPQAR